MSNPDPAAPAPKKISEIVAEKAGLLTPKNTVEEAGTKMREMNVTSLPVSEERRLVGTVTDKHTDLHLAGRGHDPKSTLVGESMSREIIFCYEDQNAAEAQGIMDQHGLHSLPVVDREMRIVGVITRDETSAETHS